MAVTQRDFEGTLKLLARYYIMCRSQLTRAVYRDAHERVTRRRLQSLSRDRYIKQHTMQVVNPARGGSIPVYHLDQRGREYLSVQLRDDAYLLKPISVSHALHLYHALLVTDVYMTIDAAIAKQDRVTLEASYHEHEIVNTDEPDPKKHYRLRTEITHHSPRIICDPDLAVCLGVDGHQGCFLIEVETGKNGPRWVASRKYRGYAELAKRGLHRRYFPTVQSETPYVLSIWPTPNFRDAFLRQLRNKDGADLWRAAAMTELTADTFLFEPIWYRIDDEKPGPLVKP